MIILLLEMNAVGIHRFSVFASKLKKITTGLFKMVTDFCTKNTFLCKMTKKIVNLQYLQIFL